MISSGMKSIKLGDPLDENTEIGPDGKVLGEDSGDIISLRKRNINWWKL